MICGHMRTLGDDRVLHVCIKTDIVHEDHHLLIPWHEYAEQTRMYHRGEGTEPPDWFDVLETQAKRINREEFLKALREDPLLRQVPADDPPPPLPDENDPDHVKVEKLKAREDWDARRYEERHPLLPKPETPATEQEREASREKASDTGWYEALADLDPDWVAQERQCEVTREHPVIPRMMQRCGLRRLPGAPCPHGDWQNLDPTPSQPEPDPPAGQPLGRSQEETWRRVMDEDPEAWRAPDDADRSSTPPEGRVPDSHIGWGVTGRGSKPGQVTHIDIKLDNDPPSGAGAGGPGMASVAEVQAAILAANQLIAEGQKALLVAKENIEEAIGQAEMALQGSGHDAVSGGKAFLAQASTDTDSVIQQLQAAVEAFDQYSGAL